MSARVLIVPGLAVRRYMQLTTDVLCARRIDAHLLGAPGALGYAADLRAYGEQLARQIDRDEPVDLLVGLSVGAQAAAVTAAVTRRVRHLVMVSPTVDPQARTAACLSRRWLAGSRLERPRLIVEQAPDWLSAGPRRVSAVVRSAIQLHLEDVLPAVGAKLTVVHAQHDAITSHSYAATLAADHGGRLVIVPGATHSWPYADEVRFADMIEDLLG